nr:T9SS type A sorting domain-containing protein [Bacteroidota bacterium]
MVKIPDGVEVRVKYNFTLDGTLELFGDLYIKGCFVYNGTITGTGTVHYESTTQQSVAGGNYPKLVLDNPGGLVLEESVFVETELVLEVGGLILGEHNLVLGPNATVVEIKAPATWVDATGTGMVIKMFDKTGTFEFPVGNFGTTPVYSPVIVHLNQATFNDGQISVRLRPEVHPDNNTGAGFPNYLNRYWVVEGEGLSNVQYDISFWYAETDVAGNEDSIDGAKYDDEEVTNWLHFGKVNPEDHSFEAIELTSFSVFTGVQGFRPPTLTITSPADKTKVYEYNLDISGTAADIDDDLAEVYVKLNDGSWQLATGAAAWNKTITLVPGMNTIYAKSKDDQAMESAEKQIEVILSAQEISIPEGWSYISSFLEPMDMKVDSVMKDLTDPYNLVIMMCKNGLYAPPPFNINTMVNWNCEMGYKVKMTSPADLLVTGDALADNDPTFGAGQHIIPVLSDGMVQLSDLFDTPQTDIIYLWDMTTNNVYWPAGGIYTLNQLNAGAGYLAYFSNEVTLDFSSYEGYVFDAVYMPPPYAKGPWTCKRTGNIHLISVSMEAAHIVENADYIGAFDLIGNCIGYTPIDQRDQNYLLTVYGDDEFTAQQDGAIEGELITYRSIDLQNGEETELTAEYSNAFPNTNGLYATNGLSGIVSFTESATGLSEGEFAGMIQLFPNPARNEVYIVIPEGFPVSNRKAEFIDATGSMVKAVSIESVNNRINIADLNPGVYVIRITIPGYVLFKKLVVQ